MSVPYYADEQVTLYHGDCREVLPTLNGIAATVTSPPYNQLSRMGDRGGMHSGGKWTSDNERFAYEDDLPEDEYQTRLSEVAAMIRSATNPGGSMFYNHKIRYRGGRPIHPLLIVSKFNGWRLRQEIVWHTGAVAFNARMFTPCDERIYWMINGDEPHKWNQQAASYLSVWRMRPAQDIDGHPCPFPLGLPTRCIVASTDRDDLVLDPYMGTGTTVRAAIDLGRRAIGIEIDERYCEIAVRRLAQGVLEVPA